MPTLAVRSRARSDMVDITAELQALTPARLNSGVCHVFCPHTTAALAVNENADPDVVSDMLAALDKSIPWNDSMYRHSEGNSAAHVKSALFGVSLSLPVEGGKLGLGTWQGVYLCEFDGPRQRRVEVKFLAAVDD